LRPILIPEYLGEFSCIGSACEDTCCAGWKVTVDKKTYQTYRKVRQPEIAEKLDKFVKRERKQSNENNYAKFVLKENSKCSMLLEDGLCTIHKELGEEYLCNTCFIYPRHLSRVGQMVEKSLTLSCPEATRIVLLQKEGIGFLETEEPKNTRGLISHELNLEKYPYFWDLRVFTIQLLQSRQQPLEIRLIILGLFIQKIDQVKSKELEKNLSAIMQDYLARLDNEEYIASLKDIKGNLSFQVNLVQELIRYRLSTGGAFTKYTDILKQMVDGLGLEDLSQEQDKKQYNMQKVASNYYKALTNIYRPFIEKNEYMLENYAVNYIFKNLFPYEYDTLFESYAMLVVHFALIKLHLLGMSASQQQLTQEMVVECVQQLSKTIEHNPVYLKGVRDGMNRSGFNTMGHMFVMINS